MKNKQQSLDTKVAHPIYSNVDNYANAGNEQLDNAKEFDNGKIGLKSTS